MRPPLQPAFTLVVVLLLRLSAALSVFGTPNRVGVIGTSPSVPPPSLSMKTGIGGPLSSWRRSKSRPSLLALIGGIASGKSTVSRALSAECGLEVIDADKLGHESYQPGTRCFSRLVDAFGSKIVSGDGTIDRRALGEAVFGNPSNMARLQGIVWPEIRLLVQQKIDGLAREGAESVVLEAAVLLEAGWDDMCDELWVVQVPPAVGRARLMKRNGFSEEEADKRIASQPMTNEERAARAAVVLSNEGSEEDLVAKVSFSPTTWFLCQRRNRVGGGEAGCGQLNSLKILRTHPLSSFLLYFFSAWFVPKRSRNTHSFVQRARTDQAHGVNIQAINIMVAGCCQNMSNVWRQKCLANTSGQDFFHCLRVNLFSKMFTNVCRRFADRPKPAHVSKCWAKTIESRQVRNSCWKRLDYETPPRFSQQYSTGPLIRNQ
ncbi:unnamed protein product [Pylaiella littoralis]